MRKIFSLLATFLFLISGQPQIAQAVDTSDKSLPIITSLVSSTIIESSRNKQGAVQFIIKQKVDLVVDVKANSLSQVDIKSELISDPMIESGAICRVLPSNLWSTGVPSNSQSTFPVLSQLISSKPSTTRTGWRSETYSLKFDLGLAVNIEEVPCLTRSKIRYIRMVNEAKFEKKIALLSNVAFYIDTVPSDSEEYKCPLIAEAQRGEFGTVKTPCLERSGTTTLERINLSSSTFDASAFVSTVQNMMLTATQNAKPWSKTPKDLTDDLWLAEEELSLMRSKLLQIDVDISKLKTEIEKYKLQLSAATDPTIRANIASFLTSFANQLVSKSSERNELTTKFKTKLIAYYALLAKIDSISSGSPTPTTSATPKPTTTSGSKPNTNKLTKILCVNGKVTKQIMGFNPVCPKGYKKVS